jgi:hypothetical protein
VKLVEGVLYVLVGAVPAGAVVASLAGTAVIPAAPMPTGLGEREASGASPASAEPHCPEARNRLQRLQAQAHLLDEQLRGLRSEEVALVGEPVDWPEDLAPGTGPEMAAALADRLRQDGFRVHQVECSEPPCMVSFLRGERAETDFEALGEQLGGQVGVPLSFGLEDGSMGGVAVVGYEAWLHVPQARRHWRQKLVAEAADHAVKSGELEPPGAIEGAAVGE